jgi:hypothetical protein
VEKAEENQGYRKKNGRVAVRAGAQGTQDVAAVKLRGGQKVERGGEQADPGGAANWMKEKIAGANSGMKDRGKEVKDERRTQHDAGMRGISETGDEFRVQHAENQRRDSDDETHQRAGSTDVEQSASGANGRADENESSQGADQSGEGNKKRITRMDVVMAASEEVSQLMSEQDGQKSESKRQAAGKRQGVLINERESVNELVKGDGFIVRVGDGELGAGDEAGAKS